MAALISWQPPLHATWCDKRSSCTHQKKCQFLRGGDRISFPNYNELGTVIQVPEGKIPPYSRGWFRGSLWVVWHLPATCFCRDTDSANGNGRLLDITSL